MSSRRLRDIGAGNKVPHYVYVIIETPMGSHVLYKYDEDLDLITIEKVLNESFEYPFNQGFVPGTSGFNGEPLEAIVFSKGSFAPGTVIEARPVGAVEIDIDGEPRSIIIVVPHERVDEYSRDIRDISDLPREFIEKLGSYLERSSNGSRARIKRVLGVNEAKEIILGSVRKTLAQRSSSNSSRKNN